MEAQTRWPVVGTAGVILVYSVLVLGFVATSPDLGLRCLMVDESATGEGPGGVEIRATPHLEGFRGARPREGDLLVRVGDRPIRTFLDFTGVHMELRNAPIPPGGKLYAGADPSELGEFSLPWLVEDEEGHRFVRIQFVEQAGGEPKTSWLLVQSLPLSEVLLSLVWFLLQLCVAGVGALAYWNRPFDRTSKLFFWMCLVNLAAFVGGSHWWVIGESLFLVLPFAVCAMLVPVVSLHFFLTFPRPKRLLQQSPGWVLMAVYALPAAAIVWAVVTIGYAHWLNRSAVTDLEVQDLVGVLTHLRQGIYLYLAVAAGYFVLMLAAIHHGYRNTQNAMERGQMTWIWYAGLLAAVFVGIALCLAVFDRTAFALGAAQIPMFLASLSFLLAYAVGIVRYRLMLLDQIVSKGVLYYVVSVGATLAFSVTIALAVLSPRFLNISLSSQQALNVTAVLMLFVILLIWLRDRFQQLIDRRFFREKYQLDKALERMNRAVGQFAAPESLADMMLSSCRDVLRVERAALYLRSSTEGPGGGSRPFQLVAAQRADTAPLQFTPPDSLLEALREGGSLQRVTPGTKSDMSRVQNLLRELQIDLVHPLQVDQGIVGLIMLGKKKNAAVFTAEDLTFLNALGQITNVALHSARVDEDVSRLNEELQLKIERIAKQSRQIAMLQTELARTQSEPLAAASSADATDFRRGSLKGNSRAIQQVLETVRKVASSDSSVLIRGESGTGKELLAQVLHDNSPRRSGPLVRVHCAALSASLLESELFGHVKGAFTGAYQDRVGRFELASGGTLFLDEIGDISLETQIKLLRVLQERCFEPVGGTKTVHVDVRLIAATHQDLEKLITQGRFREDLYYRLNVISITLPPLRERAEDVFELALYFLRRAAERAGKRVTHIEDEALSALERYAWPGNIRELENVIERAVVLADKQSISLADFPAGLARRSPSAPRHVLEAKPIIFESGGSVGGPTDPRQQTESGTLRHGSRHRFLPDDGASERELLENALKQCGGNKAEAARRLGMPRSTYYSKLKKYAIV